MQEEENLESKDKYEDLEAFFQLQDRIGEEVGEQIAKITKRDYSTSLYCVTVKILCIGTDRSQQTVQTKIRLLLKKQSGQGLLCLPLHQLLLDALMQCYIKLYQF